MNRDDGPVTPPPTPSLEGLTNTLPPDTQNPWEFMHWVEETFPDYQTRQPFQEPWTRLVQQRPVAERDQLILMGKAIFGYQVGTVRARLKEIDRAGGAKLRFVPDLITDTFMAEMVYRPKGDPEFGFLVWRFKQPDDQMPEFVTEIKEAAITYQPFNSGLARNGTIIFPSDVEEYGTDTELFDELHALLTKHIILDPVFAKLAIAWTMYTWVADKFPTCAYLRFLGDLGTAKTSLQEVEGHLVRRGMLVAGSTTSSPIFRLLDQLRGTLIVDEADHSTRNETWADLVKILNTGTKRGHHVLRSERPRDGDPFEALAFDPFGPKIVASREPLRDAAFESRCLSYTMEWTSMQELDGVPLFLDPAFYAVATSLRNKLLLWRFRNYHHVDADPRARIPGVEEARTNVIGVVVLAALRDPAVRQVVEEQLVEFSRQLRASRADDSLTGITAVALLTSWVVAKYPTELPLATVTSRVQEEQPNKVGGKRISRLIEKTLGRGLKVERKGGVSRIKGTTRVRMERLALTYQVDLPTLAAENRLPWPPPPQRSPMRRG